MKARIISSFIKLSSITVGFIINFYLASILDKNDFGIFSVIVSLFSLCLIFSNMGISFSIIDIFPKAKTKHNLILLHKKIMFFSIMSSVVVGIIAASYAYLTNITSSNINYLLLSVTFILIIYFQNIHSSNIAILRSLQSFRSALFLESILFNLVLIIAIYFLFICLNVNLIFSFVLAAFSTYLLSSLLASYKIKRFEDLENNEVSTNNLELNLVNLFPFMLLGLVEVITTNLDVLLVRHFFGNEQTADYFLAKKMLIVFTFFWFLYNFIYTPKLSKLFTNIDNIDHVKVVKILKLKWPVLIISTICMLIINVLFEDLISIFNLVQYTDAKPYVELFSLFAFIHILTGPVVSFLNVTGLSGYSFKVVSFGAIVFILTFYPLQNHYGIIGILFALNLSLLAWKVLGIFIIRKTTGFNLLIGSYINE